MKFLAILIILFSLFNVLILKTALGCFSRYKVKDTYTIIGNELEKFYDPNIFTEGPENIIHPTVRQLQRYKAFLYFGEINVAIYIPKEYLITDQIVRTEIIDIFMLATAHLRAYFLDEVYDMDIVTKILICCIEYSIRWRNTKYIDMNYIVNCKRILGLDGDKIYLNYAAEKYNEDKMLEFLVNV